ncbi:hypothetical protein MmTuc01_0081 [Methanosarcina mazei Tuc01]|uniref:Uncharacterized protein n=1 Tax=Methanosarcina mazei Tuc01 TaxID=1236903 RepID=M1Q5X6_METMZ|nr:hypothetical protein MmTuc01_0081 [Methanosarcina mazei Tuc01]
MRNFFDLQVVIYQEITDNTSIKIYRSGLLFYKMNAVSAYCYPLK